MWNARVIHLLAMLYGNLQPARTTFVRIEIDH